MVSPFYFNEINAGNAIGEFFEVTCALVWSVPQRAGGSSMNDPGQHKPCVPGCNGSVPSELEAERLCLPHFILRIERVCADMRRETAVGTASPARQVEIANYITERAVTLASVATGSQRLSDDMRKRILSTFATLMVLRENLDRAASRRAELEMARSLRSIAVGRIA